MCVAAGAAVRLPSLLPPLMRWCLSESVLSHFSLLTQQEVVCFFFFLSGYFSASLAHRNRLAVGSERHRDQHKKGQKRGGCQKGVIAFIRLLLGFLA